MNGVTWMAQFRFQMLALGAFSMVAALLQLALLRVRVAPSMFRRPAFQLAGALFCLLNLCVAVYQYHFGSPPLSAAVMAIRMLVNAGVMGVFAMAGLGLSRGLRSRWSRIADASFAIAIQSAALVLFDLVFAAFWFWHFIQGV